ncbi:hypothetical protein HYT00_03605 [Candidatus Giovannonibacteria bacterium]|nr:hypothetical protein [Candidatus Giovannonibacteria bacterium]
MKKIIVSLSVIAAVAAVAIGASTAFFNDTETSAGNTFTAGAIDLKVDSTQHYNGMVCTRTGSTGDGPIYTWQPENGTPQPYYPAQDSPCDGTWTLTDLQNGVQKFFNFTDIKPGDNGENTISLHIDSNPAWACVDVNITQNDDVSSTEPELATGDPQNTDSIFDGELAQNIKFAAWLDQGTNPGFQGQGQDSAEGDNIWQGNTSEPLLFSNQSGPASDVLGGRTYTLADSVTGNPIPAGETRYIGLAWCAGTQSTVGGVITCDGAGMGNDTQTDMMVADIAFRVEQSRNNPNFLCSTATQTTSNFLRLENEREVQGGPWTIIDDNRFGILTWGGNGPTFDYTFSAQGLNQNTDYDLIYYADGWPGNNPGAFIGTFNSDVSGNIASTTVNGTNLGINLPMPADGNFAIGAKIWLVLSSDYDRTTKSMIDWTPSEYLFEGNVYIHYNDTDN